MTDFIPSPRYQPPSPLPWTGPAYAASSFMLLGLAIANFSNNPSEAVFHDSIFEPLGMTSSNSTAPTGGAELAQSVLADPQGFFQEGGFTTLSDGLFSRINDPTQFGTSLLSSTSLPTNVTPETDETNHSHGQPHTPYWSAMPQRSKLSTPLRGLPISTKRKHLN